MRGLLLAAALAMLAIPMATATAGCPPPGHTTESLQRLKAAEFDVPDDERDALAMVLLDCLAAPDPALRDGIAYEALAHWMRGGAFDPRRLRALRDRLLAQLEGDDADGFRKPFAALVLAEVARTDRVAPWMGAGERAAMVEAAARYLESVRDYRGYDDAEGWRHGVAHGADWLMQLALNPALERAQLDRVLAAVASQVLPVGHAYVFGEPGRLARPVRFVAARGLHSQAAWKAWLEALSARPGPYPASGPRSAWLAQRHDLDAFLAALHLQVEAAGAGGSGDLPPALDAVLRAPD
jgi:hypothetical protein